jgi:hypothetical protein
VSDAAYLRLVTEKTDRLTNRRRIMRIEVMVEGKVIAELPVATVGLSFPLNAPAFVTVSTPLWEIVEEG